MCTEHVVDDVQLAVVGDLAQLRGAAQIFAANLLHIVVERPVGTDGMRLRIFLQQHGRQLVFLAQAFNLLNQCRRVAGKVIRRRFRTHGV